MTNFQERLKELRKERGLSQRDMAKILEISHAAYAKFEVGGETNFTMLVKIARFFGVTVDYLLGETNIG